jgi:hypothetical protein
MKRGPLLASHLFVIRRIARSLRAHAFLLVAFFGVLLLLQVGGGSP